MKRILSLALAATLLMAMLCACGGPGSQASQTPSDPTGESASVPPADPTQEPTGEAPAGSGLVDLAAFAQTLQENHEFPMLERNDPADELGAAMLDNYYPGLTGMDLEQVEIYLAAISFSGGELALVQAKNAGDAAAVKEIFDARVAAKTTEGPNNYPEEVELWLHNSAVVSNGNYVMLVNHEDSEAIVSEFNALFS